MTNITKPYIEFQNPVTGAPSSAAEMVVAIRQQEELIAERSQNYGFYENNASSPVRERDRTHLVCLKRWHDYMVQVERLEDAAKKLSETKSNLSEQGDALRDSLATMAAINEQLRRDMQRDERVGV